MAFICALPTFVAFVTFVDSDYLTDILEGGLLVRLFFATDIHGSEICWKKFLNAGKFYQADLLVLGGDMTGKALVPITRRPDGTFKATLLQQEFILKNEDEARDYLHRGIAARQFVKTFVLADGIEVTGADLADGLLSIDLTRPEGERVSRRIDIRGRA